MPISIEFLHAHICIELVHIGVQKSSLRPFGLNGCGDVSLGAVLIKMTGALLAEGVLPLNIVVVV